jgi:hypothetical protein
MEPGPISALLEAAAAAVGVGMVLGGFFAGLAGRLLGRAGDELEGDILSGGYLAASVCLGLRLVELAHIV